MESLERCTLETKTKVQNRKKKPIPNILPIKYLNKNQFFSYDSSLEYKGEDKGSGFLYMLRSEKDQIIKFTDFNVYK